MIQPFAGTATRRREHRQALRNALGVSRDPAPTLKQLARAVGLLNNIVQLSTAGDYTLRVQRRDGSLVDAVWTEWKEG